VTVDARAEGSNAAAPSSEAPHPHAFQADVARLLSLMVHSIYSERDIFLRELVSNAADACERLRYEALADPALTSDGVPFTIILMIDKDARTLSITDNGIGMDADDLVHGLGTIASSGTRAFLEKLKPTDTREGSDAENTREGGPGADAAQLIGQFGIGFYSAFMAADRVDIETRRAGRQDAWAWSSDGKGSYTIAPLPPDKAPARGTRVILHLSSAASEYLEPSRLERIVKDHSGGVAVPIELRDTPTAEARRLTDGLALWTRPKNAIKPEEYAEFFRGIAGQFDAPALTLHWHVEGRQDYTVLAFIPGSRPLDLFDPTRKGRVRLYVRRVLITHDCDLLPGWLRFVRLVVDSADLPLNVSREMIQASPIFAAIRNGVTNRILQDLVKTAESEPATFKAIWDNFGAVLKEGLYEDPERRDQLFKLARFATSLDPQGGRALTDYVAALRPNQTAIYYLLGDELARLAQSPQLEGFRARGIEVLLLPDPVDAFWVSTALGFDGKPFKSVTQGAADIKTIPLAEGAAPPAAAAPSAEVATLLAFMQQTLDNVVAEVRASDRLAESAACLVAADSGPDRRLERMLAEHGRLGSVSKPILEVNPNHPLVASLARRFNDRAEKSLIEDAAWLILDEARLMDGERPQDPAAFAARLTRVLTKAIA
jgi:molecular chaperone HtpG